MPTPTPEQRADALLHATAWGSVASYFSETTNGDPVVVEMRLNVTMQQLNILKWLAYAVEDAYRQIANGKELEE